MEVGMKKGVNKQAVSEKLHVRKTSKKPIAESGNLGIKKQYLKSGLSCRVSFRLPKEAALDAKKATIVGDFNNWDAEATQMKRLKNGDFAVTLDLNTGRAYNYRYLIDGNRWENDWHTDRYEQNPYEGENSVLDL